LNHRQAVPHQYTRGTGGDIGIIAQGNALGDIIGWTTVYRLSFHDLGDPGWIGLVFFDILNGPVGIGRRGDIRSRWDRDGS